MTLIASPEAVDMKDGVPGCHSEAAMFTIPYTETTARSCTEAMPRLTFAHTETSRRDTLAPKRMAYPNKMSAEATGFSVVQSPEPKPPDMVTPRQPDAGLGSVTLLIAEATSRHPASG